MKESELILIKKKVEKLEHQVKVLVLMAEDLRRYSTGMHALLEKMSGYEQALESLKTDISNKKKIENNE
jgi:hypothetical protein